MAKDKRLTRRQALLLGFGTFAGVNILPIAGNLKNLNDKVQTLPVALAAQDRDFTVVGSAALKTRAKAKKLIYGVASQKSLISSDKQFSNAIARESNMLVAEANLLWSYLRPSLDSYDFAEGDWMAEFARTHKMLFTGTHLVWHDALPYWFEEKVNSQNAEQILLAHIKTVAGHYAGKIHAWTVVNEAIKPEDGRSDGLRNTAWLRFLGPNYIEMAFRATAEADPNALLIYNDTGLEYDKPDDEARRTAVLKLLEHLKSRNTPVHALGIQAHVWKDGRFNPTKLQAFLREVANLGLKILITEMDVADPDPSASVEVRDRIIAGFYEDYLSTVLNEPAVIAVTTWGLSDKYTWLKKDSISGRPLPLDVDMHRKLAWKAIARAFDYADKRKSSSQLWKAWLKLRSS
jgi:endo-1,4-beta-xylanase